MRFCAPILNSAVYTETVGARPFPFLYREVRWRHKARRTFLQNTDTLHLWHGFLQEPLLRRAVAPRVHVFWELTFIEFQFQRFHTRRHETQFVREGEPQSFELARPRSPVSSSPEVALELAALNSRRPKEKFSIA